MEPPSLDEVYFDTIYDFIFGKEIIDPLDILIESIDKKSIIEHIDAFDEERVAEIVWWKSSQPTPKPGPYHQYINKILDVLISSTDLKRFTYNMMGDDILLWWD